MKKLIITATANILIYVLPLSAAPGLIINWRIIVVMTAATILLLTQPALSVREAKEKKSLDRNSIYIIMLAGMLGQMVSVIEFAYFKSTPGIAVNPVIVSVALAFLVGGIVFRIWSIRTLDKYFTATVQVNAGQRIIKKGPYSIIRHPSYLGSLVAVVASALFLEAFVGTVVAAGLMLYAYHVRISVEEKALAGSFGEEYRTYQAETYRMIPGVW